MSILKQHLDISRKSHIIENISVRTISGIKKKESLFLCSTFLPGSNFKAWILVPRISVGFYEEVIMTYFYYSAELFFLYVHDAVK